MSSRSEVSSRSEPAATVGRPARSWLGGNGRIRAYRALLALAVLVAIAYEVAKSVEHGGFSTTDYFSYFTELSNLFAAAIFLYGAARGSETRSRTVELLRGAAVVYMLVTGIVYAVLLSGHSVSYPWVNTIVHRIMPIAVALDWLIDPPRMRLQLRETALWMSFPLVYVIYTLTRGAIVNWYPYFFVDPRRHGGYLLVAVDCAAIAVGILALTAATTWVGNRRSG
ncbi:MAG TPA: Pr6Pr family membrane protein [Solirubrobacteraceae bacterium]|nr:Pr6Pr family membrane protein [Solirubrobacteraceae bacterium]